MGLDPSNNSLKFETELDHRLDTQKKKNQDFVIDLLLHAVVEVCTLSMLLSLV